MLRNGWRQVADRERPSWYLDPLVAAQKKQVHAGFLRTWLPRDARRVLKTDVFEEAFGEDSLLPDLAHAFPGSQQWIAMDLSAKIAARAQARVKLLSVCFLAADVRALPLRSHCLDAILSNSTLDHFDTRQEFETSVQELAHTLRPGGRLIVTVDNSVNPLYLVLRWLSRLRWAPLPLGYSTSRAGLQSILGKAGLQMVATGRLLPNPRLFSTALIPLLRRLLGPRVDRPIQWLLDRFSTLERWPTREFTACFVTACAVRVGSTSHV